MRRWLIVTAVILAALVLCIEGGVVETDVSCRGWAWHAGWFGHDSYDYHWDHERRQYDGQGNFADFSVPIPFCGDSK